MESRSPDRLQDRRGWSPRHALDAANRAAIHDDPRRGSLVRFSSFRPTDACRRECGVRQRFVAVSAMNHRTNWCETKRIEAERIVEPRTCISAESSPLHSERAEASMGQLRRMNGRSEAAWTNGSRRSSMLAGDLRQKGKPPALHGGEEQVHASARLPRRSFGNRSQQPQAKLLRTYGCQSSA